MGKEKKNLPKKQENSYQQEQIHSILFNRQIDWQEIIYDLINTEQLDPWNINITLLSNKYLEKIQELEEDNFFISSKVLLAAALLLRIKSEILLDKYIKSIDEVLFGKKNESKTVIERIELDEDIPELIPKSPIPRFRRVTITELMESLNKAINTENRRIKKEITNKSAVREASFSLPKKQINIRWKIKDVYQNLVNFFKKKNSEEILFTEFTKDNLKDNKKSKEEKIYSFYSLLHLETQNKVWLKQEKHFGEIFVSMKKRK